MKYDLIIIGAGASGLMILKEMSEAGYNCCLLEASSRAGGRIHTLIENDFGLPVEAGAEFIHGKLPLTLELLKKAGIPYEAVGGKMIAVQKGKWLKEEEHDGHWDQFMSRLAKLKSDLTIRQFLDQNFDGDEYKNLRKAVQRFAEGFDLADISKVSALGIQKEWKHEYEIQFRIPGGYIKLTDYLLEICRKQNSVIHFSAPVQKIEYEKDNVVVQVAGNREFYSSNLAITVSAGVLKSGSIQFAPALPRFEKAFQQLGFGSVIKILLQFKTPFWMKRDKEIGFLLADEEIPTWWTQFPAKSNLLTGWLGGPRAEAKATATEHELLQTALESLSVIFQLDQGYLQKELIHHRIICWSNQPYILGGYSYDTIYSEEAKKILSDPVNDTLFFAGEALYNGAIQGTVEAALQSGWDTAKRIKGRS